MKQDEYINNLTLLAKMEEALLEETDEVAQKELMDTIEGLKNKTKEYEKLKKLKTPERSAFGKWVLVNYDDRYYNIETQEFLKVGAFNNEMNIHIPVENVKQKDGSFKEKKIASSAHIYFTNFVRNRVYTVEYAPGEDIVFQDRNGVQKLNSFSDKHYPRLADHTTGEGAEIIKLIKKHFSNFYLEDCEHIIQWLAHNVQFPGKKLNYGLAFVGIQGTGKSTAERLMRAALSDSNVRNTSSSIINAAFTDWMAGSCIRVIDELSLASRNKKVVMDTLKDAITNDSVSINRKGLSVIDGVRNTQNYIITSNHDDALAIDGSDRRWFVLNDRIQTLKDDVFGPYGEDYYDKLFLGIKEHPGAIRSWLLSVDLTTMPRIIAPSNSAKTEMFKEGQNHDYHYIQTLLDECDVSMDILSTNVLRKKFNSDNNHSINPKGLTRVLKALGYVNSDTMVKIGNIKHTIYAKRHIKISEYDKPTIKEIVERAKSIFDFMD